MKEQFKNAVEIARADIPISSWTKLNVEHSGNMHVSGQNQVYSVPCGVCPLTD